MVAQLELFTEKSDLDFIRDDVNCVRESSDKVRKSLFARHAELAKKYLELHDRMQIIERNICRNEISPISLQS